MHMSALPATETGAIIDRHLIEVVVHDFYRNIRHDDLLRPIFDDHVEDWSAHEDRLVGFWSSVLLGTKQYRGAPMAVHNAIPGLDARHFNRWLSLFRQTLTARCRSAEATAFLSRAEKIARALHGARQSIAVDGRHLLGVREHDRNGGALQAKETGERQ